MSLSASALQVVEGKFSYDDGLLPGGRRPALWFVTKEGAVVPFAGAPIDRVCAVEGSKYTKNGKWSSTTYTLRVGSAVPVCLCAPLHGSIWAQVPTWEAGLEGLSAIAGRNVDRASFEAAVRAAYPNVAARLDTAASAPPLG